MDGTQTVYYAHYVSQHNLLRLTLWNFELGSLRLSVILFLLDAIRKNHMRNKNKKDQIT